MLDAYDVQTGAEVYRARVPAIGSGFSASPVAADGKLYLGNEDGAIAVVAADRTFRHVATNDMGEPIMATPALSRGVLFVRTDERRVRDWPQTVIAPFSFAHSYFAFRTLAAGA